jgi:UDP-glucose 4-epimerase
VTVYGDGRQTRDFTFVGDVVAGTLAAAERGRRGGVYNIGGGTSVSVDEVLGLVGELLEAEIAVDRRPAARGDARHTCADAGRAWRELGFRPQVPLRIGLASQVERMLDRARERSGRVRRAEVGPRHAPLAA